MGIKLGFIPLPEVVRDQGPCCVDAYQRRNRPDPTRPDYSFLSLCGVWVFFRCVKGQDSLKAGITSQKRRQSQVPPSNDKAYVLLARPNSNFGWWKS